MSLRLSNLSILMFTATLSASWSLSAAHALTSPYKSTVEGLSYGNTHEIAPRVFRGSEPGHKVQELVDFGITDVLIFKRDARGEVARQIQALRDAGFKARQIHHLPMPWKDIDDEVSVCEHIVDGLALIHKVSASPRRQLYFHCTVGEDRTGLLAALIRQLAQGWTAEQAFQDEMCRHGYEAGNPRKPSFVVQAIRDHLTPIYAKLQILIGRGELNWGNLDRNLCSQLPDMHVSRARLPLCR